MNITINADEAVIDHILEKGYDKNYGARPLRRAIQTDIEDLLADAYLAGKVKEGDIVNLMMEEGKISFTKTRQRKRAVKITN